MLIYTEHIEENYKNGEHLCSKPIRNSVSRVKTSKREHRKNLTGKNINFLLSLGLKLRNKK